MSDLSGPSSPPEETTRSCKRASSCSDASASSTAVVDVVPSYIGGSRCPLFGWYQACR